MTAKIQPSCLRWVIVAADAPRQPYAKQAERQICEEDAAPVEQMYQDAASQRSGSHRGAAAAGPYADGSSALAGIRKGMFDQTQRCRQQQRRTASLQHASHDEHAQFVGQAAPGGGQSKYRQAGEIDVPRAVTIGQGTARQQQAGKTQDVRVHYPLQAGDVCRQRARDTLQRDIDNRRIQNHHDIAEAGGRQHAALRTLHALLVRYCPAHASFRALSHAALHPPLIGA